MNLHVLELYDPERSIFLIWGGDTRVCVKGGNVCVSRKIGSVRSTTEKEGLFPHDFLIIVFDSYKKLHKIITYLCLMPRKS